VSRSQYTPGRSRGKRRNLGTRSNKRPQICRGTQLVLIFRSCCTSRTSLGPNIVISRKVACFRKEENNFQLLTTRPCRQRRDAACQLATGRVRPAAGRETRALPDYLGENHGRPTSEGTQCGLRCVPTWRIRGRSISETVDRCESGPIPSGISDR
jgi:hypothetical protein